MNNPPPEHRPEAVDILWTGGWDSTFRVLQLVLVEKQFVRPHYVIDTARKSSLRELAAMHEIRRDLEALDPAAARRIEPCRLACLTDLADNPQISESYARLKSQSPLGVQYDWLSRYATQNGLSGIELCIHVDDKAETFLRGKVTAADAVSAVVRLRDEHLDGDLRILAPFRFPILKLTKTAMQQQALQHEFLPILERSWFCHAPIDNRPCGICNPCIFTIEEGMGYRLPVVAHFRYRLRWLYRQWQTASKLLRKTASRVLRAPAIMMRKWRGA